MVMFDTIVFSQDELVSAVESGYRRIGLCDNTFTVSDGWNIEYTLIGNARVCGYFSGAELYEGFWVNGYGISLI